MRKIFLVAAAVGLLGAGCATNPATTDGATPQATAGGARSTPDSANARRARGVSGGKGSPATGVLF